MADETDTEKATVLERMVKYLAETMTVNAEKLLGDMRSADVFSTDEIEQARTWLDHIVDRRIRRTVASDGSGLPPHAEVCWTAGDVLTKAEEKGLKMTDEEAEEFLHNNAGQIQDDMVERGWESIDTLLDMEDLEDADDEEDGGDDGGDDGEGDAESVKVTCPNCKQDVSVSEVKDNDGACPNCGYQSGDHEGMKPNNLHWEWDEAFDSEEDEDDEADA